MTLQEFSRDIVPILQLVIMSIGLVSLIILWRQIKQASLWNKLRTQHDLWGCLPDENLDKSVLKILRSKNQDENRKIPKELSENIYNDAEMFTTFKTYLNKYEQFSAAINVGAMDEDYAYRMHSARICYVYNTFENFIKILRERREEDEFYIELQRLASKWQKRTQKEKKRRESKIKKLEDELIKEHGVIEKVK